MFFNSLFTLYLLHSLTHNSRLPILFYNRHAQLTDFGLTVVKSDNQSLKTAKPTDASAVGAGSVPWMAPELFKLQPVYSPASDAYGFGMICYELATRQVPFHEAAQVSLIGGFVLAGERDTIPEDTPAPFAAVIKQCWAQSPSQRLTCNNAGVAIKALSKAAPVTNDDVQAVVKGMAAAE
jgi:serine/threonine protein kinase